jgi:hypothetical protein
MEGGYDGKFFGENPLRCSTKDERGLVHIIVFFFPYIFIPIKINESKSVKYFISTIFDTTTILNFIIIIHKCGFTW